MHELEERLGDADVPDGEHEQMLVALQRSPGSLPAARRLQHRPEDRRPSSTASASPRRTSSGRPRRSRAAGRCASRWPSCCSRGPACCCSTSRPTTSISRRATGSKEYLHDYPHAVILVSHDRFFLDTVVTRIAEVYLAHADRLPRQLQPLPRGAPGASSSAARGQAGAGRGSRADEDVHRPVPLPGDQGRAGAEPDQDAREDRADRGAARAQADPLHLPDLREERPHGARAEARPQGVRRQRRLPRRRPAHRARRPHRARRSQRRRQVDADAHALRRRAARRRRRGTRATRS